MENIAPAELKQWAELYCEIWKEPPWNEDFWKPEEVIKDFQTEMSNPDSAAFLLLVDGSVKGFTHGYSVNREELRAIANNDLLDTIFSEDKRIYYIDELGVAKECRGLGFGKLLTARLQSEALGMGIRKVVLRTDTQAKAARRVYEESDFIDLKVFDANYPNRTYWLCKA